MKTNLIVTKKNTVAEVLVTLMRMLRLGFFMFDYFLSFLLFRMMSK